MSGLCGPHRFGTPDMINSDRVRKIQMGGLAILYTWTLMPELTNFCFWV